VASILGELLEFMFTELVCEGTGHLLARIFTRHELSDWSAFWIGLAFWLTVATGVIAIILYA
jgi:hypothetical protein